MTSVPLRYQQEAYDHHYPQMAKAIEQQLSHPLLCSLYDRLARRILDGSLEGRERGTEGGPLRLLEAGCGEGLVGAAMHRVAAERGLPISYSGTDLSEAGLKLARRILPDANLVCGDATAVVGELPPGSQDIIWAKNLLHHLDDPARFLRHALRAVGTEGRVVIVEPRMWCPVHWVNLMWFRQERYLYSGYRRNLAAFRAADARVLDATPFSWLPYELAFATRFHLLRRLLSTDTPSVIERVSRVDEKLTTALPNLALYMVSVLAPSGSRPLAGASGS